MRLVHSVAILVALALPPLGMRLGQDSAQESMLHVEGLPMEIELSRTLKLNEGSTLRREHYAFNDPNLPVRITAAPNVEILYADRRFNYICGVELEASVPLAAVKVIIVTIDVWGKHGSNLSCVEIRDMAPGAHKVGGAWNIFQDADAESFWASIAFVSDVRTADGAVFTARVEDVLKEVNRIGAKLSMEDIAKEK